jgi:hypothetical protein
MILNLPASIKALSAVRSTISSAHERYNAVAKMLREEYQGDFSGSTENADEKALIVELEETTTALNAMWWPMYQLVERLNKLQKAEAAREASELAKLREELGQFKSKLTEMAGLSDDLCNAKREIKRLKGEPLDDEQPGEKGIPADDSHSPHKE